ncbi:MAG: glycosyltransferase family 4 protein [Chitinispirillales bacterium]|jgi:glycosyltransferase involved in cell wall biosynthesis|nr:glycosyltransferase family 4 protein [Chitinispirillales bacterium]
MKIAYICPGTGGAFYCENCVRDHALVSGLRALEHEVSVVPMYLPVKETGGNDGSGVPVMFGAVRLYLIDKFPSLKRAPDALLGMLDNRMILDLAAGFASSTRAGGHEEMTIDMIKGEEGPFADEFDKLTDWLLKQSFDLIFLPNAFLLGIASAVKAKSSIPVACLLQDEHVWVDASDPIYRERTWKIISDKCEFADMLYTHSLWYKKKICGLADISPESVSCIPLGVDPAKYVVSSGIGQSSIGYISRLCSVMGAGVLADAYCQLLKDKTCDNAVLEFCGGYTKDDLPVIKSSRKKVAGFDGQMRIHKHFSLSHRTELLSKLSVLSVPVQESIAFGGFITEAMASGVPVVQPDDGGFTEVISETECGVLYSPNTPEALAGALEKTLYDKDKLKAMAQAGREAVLQKYNNVNMAKEALLFLNYKKLESVNGL